MRSVTSIIYMSMYFYPVCLKWKQRVANSLIPTMWAEWRHQIWILKWIHIRIPLFCPTVHAARASNCMLSSSVWRLSKICQSPSMCANKNMMTLILIHNCYCIIYCNAYLTPSEWGLGTVVMSFPGNVNGIGLASTSRPQANASKTPAESSTV
jgi:hypothetical protein